MATNAAADRDRRWQQIQAATGLCFAVFIVMHLGNTLFALAGADTYNGLQRALQRFYQHPVVELALLAAILPAHIVAGIMRARHRRTTVGVRTPTALRLHRLSGWFLVAVVYWHAGAVRLPALLYDAWPGFAGVAFSLQWVPAWFYPYYFLLALAGLLHAVNGSRLALGRLGPASRPYRLLHPGAVAALGGALIALCLSAFGGLWFDIGDPFASKYAKVYLELVAQITGG